ncbi:hypothetical protein QTP88_013239 [Uroleucon formosanum]
MKIKQKIKECSLQTCIIELPSEDSIKKSIRNQRSSSNQKKQNNDWKRCENEQFLLKDNGPESSERIIIFELDSSLEQLANADTWFIDGNFGLAPEHSLQLYRKMENTYEEMFKIILNECNNRELYPDPLYFNVDFEIAVHKAAKTVFGEHISIRGCFYHLSQSTLKIRNLGLSKRYKEDENFNLYYAMMDELAFLFVVKVCEGMNYLKQNCPTGAEDLLQHFDENYVGESWNNSVNNPHKTNNACEGWNNRFSNLVGIKHPSIWKLHTKMCQEVGKNKARMALAEIGEINRRKTKAGKKIEVRLNILCQHFDEDESEDIPNFLKQIS